MYQKTLDSMGVKLTEEVLLLIADFCEIGGGKEAGKLFRESIPDILRNQNIAELHDRSKQ